jgi:hypothetical protein
MKILYARKLHGQDYLCDTIFHGLNQIPELEVTDVDRLWYMYKHEFQPIGNRHLHDLYGRGFTVWGLMQESSVNRNNVEKQIKNHYFDLIILSRVCPDHLSRLYDLICNHYSSDEIIALDGWDDPSIIESVRGNSFSYYKREFISDRNDILPISFSIPKEKCLNDFPNKTQAWSNVQPGRSCDYIYNNEQDYYDDYRRSLFGLTHKKGGWDCMRHYEILANRCIPYFRDLHDAPKNVMTTLPKDLLIEIKNKVDQNTAEYYLPENAGWEQYKHWEQQVHDHFINNCTTEHAARYILNNLKK